MEREIGPGQIIGHAPAGFQEHILHHITGIDPPGHAAVHAHLDHPPQAETMPLEQFVDCFRIAGPGLLQKIKRVVGFRPHRETFSERRT
jgi:hypothetical protein